MRSAILRREVKLLVVVVLLVSSSGCAIIFQRGRKKDLEEIQRLNQKVDTLSQEIDELSQARLILEDRLKQEIADKQVRLERLEKGLVITFVADVLFDSGKAEIKKEANATLDKVARVLIENVADLRVGIEGHTDNEPIKYSKWHDNWELSSERALSVLRYLIGKGVSPDRLSAIGYGEFRPVASNTTQEGRQLNRRVEVIILPKTTAAKESSSQPAGPEAGQSGTMSPEELKTLK